MEATPAMDFTTEFVINKPANIYAEAELEETNEVEEEAIVEAAPVHNYQFESVVETVFANDAVSEEEDSIEEVVFEAETEVATVTEFQSSFRVAEQEEPSMQLIIKDEMEGTPEPTRSAHPSYDMSLDNAEEQRRKVAERIQKLRNLSFNINNSTDPNTEFDAVPAYVRRNLDLFGNTLASVENYYSKYTVEPDENNQAKLSTINTFLDGKKPD
jgi:cell division protein FtsZ